MKPKPFASLNHFTVPLATLKAPSTTGYDPNTPHDAANAQPDGPGSGTDRDAPPGYKKAAGSVSPAATVTPCVLQLPSGQQSEYRPEPAACKAKSFFGAEG